MVRGVSETVSRHLANGHLANGHLANRHLANGHLANIQKFISYIYMYIVIFLSLCMVCQYYVLFMDVANIGLSLDNNYCCFLYNYYIYINVYCFLRYYT